MHFPRPWNWLMMKAGLSTDFLTKTCHTSHYINTVLSMDSIKHLCHNWCESHFLLIDVCGCLCTLRLVRAALPACLYAGSLSSAWSTAERWEAKCWCSSFDGSLKASSCCLWLLSCAVIIVVCNDVLRHCTFPGCDLKNQRQYFGNSFSIYYIC